MTHDNEKTEQNPTQMGASDMRANQTAQEHGTLNTTFTEPTNAVDTSSPSTSNEDTMTINLKMPDITELKPKITVFGVGGAGGNAVNNMIKSGLEGVEFVVANTDAQALSSSRAERVVQMGLRVTAGLGAGSQPEIGRQAAEEVIDELNDYLTGSHMAFITAGMGGGTGTGAAPVVARAAREMGILTVGVVTKPFQFEGGRRMRLAEQGIEELQANVDTLIVIPNQNLFRVANEKTTFADAFSMADQVLYSGVACITDLMVKEGLINLDFADVRSVMREMGKAMMGTGEASGANRATEAAEAAIANPLLDETSMHGAQGLLISITGGNDLTLFEVDEAATRIREEVDPDANIILGATFDEALEGIVRVSVVATGIEHNNANDAMPEPKTASGYMPSISTMKSSTTNIAPTHAGASNPEAGKEPAKPAFASGLPVASAGVKTAAPFAPMSQPEVAKTDSAVTIARFTPSEEALKLAQSAYEAPVMDEFEAEESAMPIEEATMPSGPFIPPVAEAPMNVHKMPSVDDFPMIVQEEIRAKASSTLEVGSHEERGALGLLKRITSATLGGGRKDDDMIATRAVSTPVTATMPSAAPRPAAPMQPSGVAASAFSKPVQPAAVAPAASAPMAGAQSRAPAPQPGHSTAYAPQAGKLDPQGRAVPKSAAQMSDDQLEIPAFLRRQAQ